MKFVTLLTSAVTTLLVCDPALCADAQPTSEGALTSPKNEPQRQNELVFRIGNESNPVDGILGPFTYGARGSHLFENDFAIEAGYIRLHEPNTPASESVLDEAQVTLRSPEYQSFVFDATFWKNRMIDLYTNLLGFEATRKGTPSVTLGVYLGTATRGDESGKFRGGLFGVSAPVGPVELNGACLLGEINGGSYRKCGIEGGIDFRQQSSLPLTATFAIEERYFDFGNGGSVSEPRDEYIFISGLEVHLEKIRL